jgi:alkanesulfonate monooxygenase SsuD/methylene tetrahydromethanopterin reductase-like flavin-dependent oxidoreductase (luciferase family)
MRVSITVPVAEDEQQRPTPYVQIRELARAAEAAGLDGIYAADHIFYQQTDVPPRGFWESWTLLSALAEATQRVELGNLVLCAPFRNPTLLAYMANTLEEVSGGRLVLGLGSGWHEPEFRAGGFEFDRRVSVYEDYLKVIVALLRARRADYAGEFAQANLELRPVGGPRPAGPPILTASKGPRMHRLSATYSDRWNTAWYGLPSDPFWERRDGLHAACRKIGRDPDEIEINVGLDILDASAMSGEDGRRAIEAKPDEIAGAFAAWQEQGVAEVICRLEPTTPQMVEQVARAAEGVRPRAAVPQLPPRLPVAGEEPAQVTDEQLGLFHGREVAALHELGPVLHL